MKNKNLNWLITVCTISFILSIVMSLTSETFIPKVNIFFGIIIILLFIFISIIFDMILLVIIVQDVI